MDELIAQEQSATSERIIDIDLLLRIASRKGMNQTQLLAKAQVNKSTLSRMRRGMVRPHLSTLLKLIEAVNQ